MFENAANSEYSALASIRSQLTKLSPAERKVAVAILENPYGAVGWSAQDLAEEVGTSAATVVRACRSLDFDGLPELRLALARELGRTRISTAAPAVGADAILLNMLASTAKAVGSMGEHIDLESFRKAATIIRGARRLLLVCAGPTQVVCRDAMFDLISIGRPAEFIDDSVVQLVAASRLRPGDVCVAIGISGENNQTIVAAQAARDAGATLIVMTGFPRSPLAKLGEICIAVSSPDMPAKLYGTACLVSMLVVFRALTALISQESGDRSDSPLQGLLTSPVHLVSQVNRQESSRETASTETSKS